MDVIAKAGILRGMMRSRARTAWVVVAGLMLFTGTVRAQTPEETLLVVNRASAASVRVAARYIALRAIPDAHVVEIRVPAKFYRRRAAISPEDFTRYIWEPVAREVKARGLDDKVLAWIYSVDFPILITSPIPVSLTGVTFVRNNLPESEAIRQGQYLSPLYGGPDPDGPAAIPTRSLREMKKLLGGHAPLPNMLLGYIGPEGNDVETVIRCLERGAASDGTAPSARFFFCTSSDVRSTCRDWQFSAVAKELQARGFEAEILPHLPARAQRIMGQMVGRATVYDVETNEYLPGAMAEHLTSAAASFDRPGQDRLTRWIAAGCTASAGTVTEPYAIWAKFPHAQFYLHYVNGATMLESFYMAVRCPMQILLVGDPLACPWKKELVGAKGENAVVETLETAKPDAP